MTTKTTTPRIYVACLASYTAGILHGAWIEANQDEDAIQAGVNEMLSKSTQADAEEWAIHDYEGFCGLKINEYDSFERVSKLAELIEEHGEAIALFADYHGGDIAYAEENFEEAYQGCFSSELEFAEQLFDELYLHEFPAHLQSYIDYDRFERDLFCGDYFSCDGEDGVHIFRSL